MSITPLPMPEDLAAARPRSEGSGLSPVRWFRGYGLFLGVSTLWLLSTFSAFWFDSVLAWMSGLFYVAYDTWLIAYVAWQTRHLKPQAAALPSPGDQGDKAPTLGIIIPGRNEASVLAATLDTVLSQIRAGDTVLMVDDGSTDSTRQLLASRYGVTGSGYGLLPSTRHLNLKVLFKPNSGKADSLNAGLLHLHADVIVTIDADTRLDSGALEGFRAAFAAEPALAAACGILKPTGAGGWQAKVFELFQQFEYLRAFLSRAAWMRSNALLLVSGAFAAYRREVLEKIGGFDPQCLVEDYELIHRLHQYAAHNRLDWTVRVLPMPRAETDAPADVPGFLRQRRRWFAGFLQTQFAYRQMHGDAGYGSVGRLMLPVKAVDTLQPIFGIAAFVLLVLFLISGSSFAPVVLWVIGGKLLIDFSYHYWAIRQYHRWLGQPIAASLWARSTVATLLEPFSFQLLRHLGAAWGWWQILTGRRDWAPQRRSLTPQHQGTPP